MLPHVASRIFGTPLLLHPEKATIIVAALQDRLDVTMDDPSGPEASRFIGSRLRGDGRIALTRAAKGVALITVEGTLINRGPWINARSGLTSYEGVAAQLKEAVADPEIKAIVLDIDSPGGEASGTFTLAAAIREARKSKRIVAVVDDVAASAAYGIASAAHEIVISTTSVVGSIGVAWLHLDRTGEMEQRGIRPTLIHAGARKVDGNPMVSLSAEALADMQKQINVIYERFLEAVEAGRGARTTSQRARETEARVYVGSDAIKAGLADRVASLDQVLAELSSTSDSRGTRSGSTVRSEVDQRMIAAMSLPGARGHEEKVAALVREGKSVAEVRTVLALAEREKIAASWSRAIEKAGAGNTRN